MQRLKNFITHYWPTLLVASVIIYATISDNPTGVDALPPIPYIDKLIHAVMFGGLFSAWAFDRRRSGHVLTRKYLYLTAAVCIAAGGLDELAQGVFTARRAADITDWLADITGIAVAIITAPPAISAVLGKRS